MINSISKRIISHYEKKGQIGTNLNISLELLVLIAPLFVYHFSSIFIGGHLQKEGISFVEFALTNIEYILLFPIVGLSFFSYCCIVQGLIIKSAHNMIAGKDDRENEIRAFFEQNEDVKKGVKKEKIVYNLVNQEDIPYRDLHNWVGKYSSSNAFKKMVDIFCEKSALDNYDTNLIQWANNIPLERISENSRLELMRYNKNINHRDTSLYVSNVEHLFSRYNEKQIRNLFYSPFDGTSYFRSLVHYASAKETPEPLPVLTRMNSLIDFMNGDVANFPKDKFKLTGKMNLGHVDHVSSRSLLLEYAKMFSNCAKSYNSKCEKGEYFFYVINRDNPIMFSLNKKGKLIECKYKLNRDLSTEDKTDLLNYIKSRV